MRNRIRLGLMLDSSYTEVSIESVDTVALTAADVAVQCRCNATFLLLLLILLRGCIISRIGTRNWQTTGGRKRNNMMDIEKCVEIAGTQRTKNFQKLQFYLRPKSIHYRQSRCLHEASGKPSSLIKINLILEL